MSRVPARFDPTIHAAHRLRVCGLLADLKELEFAVLRDALSLSDSVLSKQLAILVQAGYVRSRRAKRDSRQRVWLALTPGGRRAFSGHVAALREIVGDADQRQASPATRSGSEAGAARPIVAEGMG